MAFQAVPDTAEIDLIFSSNAVVVQNVLYAKFTGGYTLADLQVLADKIDLQVHGTWKPQMVAEAIYIRTEVRGLAFENDLTAQQSLSSGPGGHVGAALPNNVTFSIKKTSGLTGRSARGRTFWIGIPDVATQSPNENLIDITYASDVVVALGTMRVAIATLGGWEPVLVSRFSDGVKRPVGVTFPWVGETNVDLRVDTNRGRLPTL